MNTLTSATQQNLVLFNQGSVASESSSDLNQARPSRLNTINSLPNMTVTQSKVSTDTPLLMRVTKNMNRLKSLIPTNKEGIVKAAKSIWKGTALGAIAGAITGLAFLNIPGALKGGLLGGFLGGFSHTTLNTFKNMRDELKHELLEQASFHVTQEGGQTMLSEGGTDSEQKVDINYQNTTMFYTEGKSSIKLNKLGNSLKVAEPKIAITMLNAKNNAKHNKLRKLDLSGNGPVVNEKFLSNLIKLAGEHAGKEFSVGGAKSKVRHGLDQIKINVTNSDVKSGDDLKDLLEKAKVGQGVSVTTVTGSRAAQVRFKPQGVGREVTIDLKVDKDFAMQSKQDENDVADAFTTAPGTRAASEVDTTSESRLASDRNVASISRAATEASAALNGRAVPGAVVTSGPELEANLADIASTTTFSEVDAVYELGTTPGQEAVSGTNATLGAEASVQIGGPSYTGETSVLSETTKPLAPAV